MRMNVDFNIYIRFLASEFVLMSLINVIISFLLMIYLQSIIPSQTYFHLI